jgi:penicillin-binding protein 1A
VETVPGTEPPATPAPKPVIVANETGTTIPPDVLDPRAPLPSVPLDRLVQACGVTP